MVLRRGEIKRSLAVPYKLMRQVIDPYRLVVSIPEFARYIKDFVRYSKMDGAEALSLLDAHPCLSERTRVSSFDSHYFHLNIWAAKRIFASGAAVHVDVGSRVDFVGFLSCFKKVIHVDIRPLEAQVVNLECRKGNILNLPFEDASVASLSCLHVAEHIGLGRYGDNLDPRGTEKAARELSRILAEGGDLFFAVPVGKPRTCFNAHRIHSTEQILKYFNGLLLKEFSGVDDNALYQENLSTEHLNDFTYACGFFWFKKPTRR
jgi:SAM-dependent methyltransferase